MAKKEETLFKDRIRWRLDALPRSWWVKIQLVALVGFPDFIGCLNGQFIALELKKSKYDHASRLQRWCLEKIIKAGGLGVVVDPDNFEQVFQLLTKISRGEIKLTPEEIPPLESLDS